MIYIYVMSYMYMYMICDLSICNDLRLLHEPPGSNDFLIRGQADPRLIRGLS